MLLRTLVLARPGDCRRRLSAALDAVDSLITNVGSVDDVRTQLARKPFDLVILERAPLGASSATLVAEVRGTADSPDVIVLTDSDDVALQAELIAAGCSAVLDAAATDEALAGALETLAARKLEAASARNRGIPGENYRLGDYATSSPAMKTFLQGARRVASKDTTLLLLGETGVGKGLLARALHNEGPRAGQPFIGVNCGALSDALLESQLFGHEKGAFTGADRVHRGFFELAHRGTIFIDEVGEIPLHLQVKLLRILEDQRVFPLGSERSIDVDVRIIAATNKDLAREVEEKRFRRDLFYRLNVVSLTLPPLRERREDIPELAQSYVDHFAARSRSDVKGLSPDAMTALLRHPWPGNLRELINAVERGVIMSLGEVIQVEDLPVEVQELAPLLSASLDPDALADAEAEWLNRPWSEARRHILEEGEVRYLSGILRETGGRIAESARRAGLDPRSIHQKMKKYGLKKEDFR